MSRDDVRTESSARTEGPASDAAASALPMLAVMCLATFVAAFNENIINVALADIMGTFSVGAMTAQWLVTGYMIVTSIFTACITLGPACGPVVSGLTVTLFGWRAICSAPLVGGVIVAASGALLMRNVGKRRSVRLNAPSLVLLAVGLTAFVFSVGELSENLLFGACVLVVALVLVGMFARRQLALGQPLLDIRPMLSSRFWPVCVLLVVTMMTSFPMSVLLPLCFEGVFWHERAHGRPARPARSSRSASPASWPVRWPSRPWWARVACPWWCCSRRWSTGASAWRCRPRRRPACLRSPARSMRAAPRS